VKILTIGDIVGKPGRRAVTKFVPKLLEYYKLDLVIANGENIAGGMGITPDTVADLFAAGCDVVTSGNHIWAKKRDVIPLLGKEKRILRPANYPDGAPGEGALVAKARSGTMVGVVNLMGRAFMSFPLSCPFRAADDILDRWGSSPKVVIVDMHGEASAEKRAMGHYLDGRVTAVVGTHTHVTTADEQVLPDGTAYITDQGMTGSHSGVIGMEAEVSVRRFLSGMPHPYRPSNGDVQFNGALIEVNPDTGRATSIQRVRHRLD